MEGLEATEVCFSDTHSIIDFRIDSETYKKIYLETDNLLCKKTTSIIDKLSVSVQNFGAYSLCNYINFVPDGIRFLMTQNIRDNYIDFEGVNYITPDIHDILYKSHCKQNQVLLTMAGEYLGRAAVFNKTFECSSNQAIAKISLFPDSISPYYLSTFLNGKYGQNQIQRFKTTTGQPNINMSLIKDIRVVMLNKDFQITIENLIVNAVDFFELSKKKHEQSLSKLLKYLDLEDWSLSQENTAIKLFSDCISRFQRIDAEYYQPKYNELLTHISSYETDILYNLVYISKSIEPGSDAYLPDGTPFFRVADLSKYGLSQPEIFLDRNKYDVKGLSPKKDTILLSKDGSVGIAYKVEENIDGITSGAILHLEIKDDRVLPDYLCLVLNSTIVQLQAERDSGGSIIQHWKPDEIKQVVIPILPKPIQEELCGMIKESFSLRRESKQLLDAAKYAVELAIEHDEIIAENWLKENNFIQ